MSTVDFASVTQALADAGQSFRFPAHGRSMRPFIHEGDVLTVVTVDRVRRGDVVFLCKEDDHCLAHRVIRCYRNGHGIVALRTQGDANGYPDPIAPWTAVVGRVVALERSGRIISLTEGPVRWLGLVWAYLAPLRRMGAWFVTRVRRMRHWLLQRGHRT